MKTFSHQISNTIFRTVFALIAGFGLLVFQAAPAFAQSANGSAINQGSGASSFNWSGYSATSGNFTGIGATWTVPSATATQNLSSDVTWIGIGGVNSSDLIQIGTQAMFINGQMNYQAWYETLPNDATPIAVSVRPGDSITAALAEASPGSWIVSLHDNTTGQSYSSAVAYVSSNASAEWIEEMPSTVAHVFYPLDNFGTVNFSNAWTTENGTQMTLSAAGAEPVTMVTGAGLTLAAPLAIGADQQSFSVTRNTAVAPDSASSGQAGTVPGVVRIVFRRGGSDVEGFHGYRRGQTQPVPSSSIPAQPQQLPQSYTTAPAPSAPELAQEQALQQKMQQAMQQYVQEMQQQFVQQAQGLTQMPLDTLTIVWHSA